MKSDKIYRLLTAMSSLAILAPITGENKWLTFLCFLGFFSLIKTNYDERMKNNINRANRNGYYAAILSLSGLMVIVNLNMEAEFILQMIQGSIIVCTLVTSISFTYFEKSGK